MPYISDERNWLTWLVKVRILILMVLLAIELAVMRLTPSPLPIMPSHRDGAVVRALAVFPFSGFGVEGTPPAGHSAGARRSGHGHAGGPSNWRHRQLA